MGHEAPPPPGIGSSQRLIHLPDHLGCMWSPEGEDFILNTNQLTKRMKHQVNVLNHFWKQWRSEYLRELRESHRYLAKKITHQPHLFEGDIVKMVCSHLCQPVKTLSELDHILRPPLLPEMV